MPKVSICVPTYQNQEEVKRLIDSARKQTFRNFELIITDDSKDNEIKDYIDMLCEEKDSIAEKIKYYHNENSDHLLLFPL